MTSLLSKMTLKSLKTVPRVGWYQSRKRFNLFPFAFCILERNSGDFIKVSWQSPLSYLNILCMFSLLRAFSYLWRSCLTKIVKLINCFREKLDLFILQDPKYASGSENILSLIFPYLGWKSGGCQIYPYLFVIWQGI